MAEANARITTSAITPDARERFAEMVTQHERGKLKLYIGSAAGVGKTYRMLQEANELRRRGIDVVIGFVETHGRPETLAQLGDVEVVPRRQLVYRGVTLEEMDVDAVVARQPHVAVVDELAHSNVPGSRFAKRWEDVRALLDAGIHVISAVNVQHVESLNDIVERALAITVRETVPDWVVAQADQVVNVDLSAEDLRQRLRDGKVYRREKIESALQNFFTEENLSALRELALREVANSVDRARGDVYAPSRGRDAVNARVERVMACLPSRPDRSRSLLRKASRIAGRLNGDWYCVYVRMTPERYGHEDTATQRRVSDAMKFAQELGAESIILTSDNVADALSNFALEYGVTLAVVGPASGPWWQRLRSRSVVDRLLARHTGLDVLVVSEDAPFKANGAIAESE